MTMNKSNYDEKLYNREALMMDVTEDLLIVMEDKGIKKIDLAKLLSKSKSFISQTLSGSRNITLRTLADIAFALDAKVSINFELKDKVQATVDNISDESVKDVVAEPQKAPVIKLTGTTKVNKYSSQQEYTPYEEVA